MAGSGNGQTQGSAGTPTTFRHTSLVLPVRGPKPTALAMGHIMQNEREGSIQLRDLVAPELLQVFAHFVLRSRHLVALDH